MNCLSATSKRSRLHGSAVFDGLFLKSFEGIILEHYSSMGVWGTCISFALIWDFDH
jgi:hypothetical protein